MLALLAQPTENPYWNAPALTFYGVIIAAVLAGPIAIILGGRVRAQEAEAAAKRAHEEEESKAKRERDAASAKDDSDSLSWLRGQVDTLQATLQRQARQIEQLQAQSRALREQMRERDSDDRARDGRISQLEAALRAAQITVPPAATDYLALLDREHLRRRRGEKE